MTLKTKELRVDDLRQTIQCRFEPQTRDDSKPKGYVEGWASTASLDLWNSIFHVGAFQDAILKRGLKGPSGIKLLLGHDWDKPAGKIEALEYRGDKLWIAAQFGLSISYVRDFYEAARMQEGFNFSIGARIEDYYFDKDDVLHVNRADLFEVSAVPFPGNEECVMTSIRANDGANDDAPKTVAEFEKYILAQGLTSSRRNANRIARVVKACNLDMFKKQLTTVLADSNDDEKPLLAKDQIAELTRKAVALQNIQPLKAREMK